LDDPDFSWAKDLGVLRGSFYEMGVQYGEKAAVEIREMFDYWIWPNIMYAYESTDEALWSLRQYIWHAEAISPQWMTMVRGIADGAASELDKSIYNDNVPSHFDKVFALNMEWAVRSPPQWRLVEYPMALATTGPRTFEENPDDHACNSVYVKGPATKDGQAYTLFCNQHTPPMKMKPKHRVKFIMIPDDPEANAVWVLCTTGRLFQNGMCLNEKGVFMGVQYGGSIPDEEKDYGVECYTAYTHAAWYADTALETVEILTVGTPEYRAKTGRRTLLRTRQQILTVTDENEGYIVEYTAAHYGIRGPGYLGEIGNSYVAASNNYFCNHTWNENNEFSLTKRMTDFNNKTTATTSAGRCFTFMWNVKNNYGNVDKDMIMYEFAPQHHRYMENGTIIEPEIHPDGYFEPITSVCSHGGPPAKGSFNTVVVSHQNKEVWWVPAWPCLFQNRAWFHDDLKSYALLREEIHNSNKLKEALTDLLLEQILG
jgi:hypothetical protein